MRTSDEAPGQHTTGETNKNGPGDSALPARLQNYFLGGDSFRRGICLLNAGKYDEAIASFTKAANLGYTNQALPAFMAACYLGKDQPTIAAQQFDGVLTNRPNDIENRIRHALVLAAGNRPEEAIQSLREGIRLNPECPELHFQLGLLLATTDRLDEAELRFTQTTNLDPQHVEALVNLALCCAARQAPADAVTHLQRAQAKQRNDVRIGTLLAQAARSAGDQGQSVRLQAVMPDASVDLNTEAINDLASVIEKDADLLEALLVLPEAPGNERIFEVIARSLEQLLASHPDRADYHFHHARAMERLGDRDQAIIENERAVQLDPTLTRALIELGRLYEMTSQTDDAIARLESATAAGATYPDVYHRLGNLYRANGQLERARGAYERALELNDGYVAADAALRSLPA